MNHHRTVHSFAKAGVYRPKAAKQTYNRKHPKSTHTSTPSSTQTRHSLCKHSWCWTHRHSLHYVYSEHTGPHRSQPCMSNRQQQLVSNHYSMVCSSVPRTNERGGEADGPQMIPIMTVALINRWGHLGKRSALNNKMPRIDLATVYLCSLLYCKLTKCHA